MVLCSSFPREARCENAGDVVRIVKEAELRKGPVVTSPSLGKLPDGSLVVLRGEQKNGFFAVSVELEDEKVLEGWVYGEAIDIAPQEARPSRGSSKAMRDEADRVAKEVEHEPETPPKKIKIPMDEGLLITRENKFFYGLQAGGNFNIMTTDIDTNYYTGFGMTVGGHVGLFLARNIPLRFEVDYTLVDGVATETQGELKFGYFDIAALIHYNIEPFELFGGAQYSVCLSVNNIPQQIQIETANDLSSIVFPVGVGYRMHMTEFVTLVLRGRYSISLLMAPVWVQYFGISMALEFMG